jgi:hypothetical protein
VSCDEEKERLENESWYFGQAKDRPRTGQNVAV